MVHIDGYVDRAAIQMLLLLHYQDYRTEFHF